MTAVGVRKEPRRNWCLLAGRVGAEKPHCALTLPSPPWNPLTPEVNLDGDSLVNAPVIGLAGAGFESRRLTSSW